MEITDDKTYPPTTINKEKLRQETDDEILPGKFQLWYLWKSRVTNRGSLRGLELQVQCQHGKQADPDLTLPKLFPVFVNT
jgi:hypothetical protein